MQHADVPLRAGPAHAAWNRFRAVPTGPTAAERQRGASAGHAPAHHLHRTCLRAHRTSLQQNRPRSCHAGAYHVGQGGTGEPLRLPAL